MTTDATRDTNVQLFFGFALPRVISGRVSTLRTLVDDPKNVVSWTKGVNLHLTLRFIGPTPESAVQEIVDGMEGKLNHVAPVKVRIEGTGLFPAIERPRVLWLGVTGEVQALHGIEKIVHDTIEPLGYPRQDREYHPHVTIGRIRYPKKVAPNVKMYLGAQYEPVDCSLKVLHLYQSIAGLNGIIYTPLASFPIGQSEQES